MNLAKMMLAGAVLAAIPSVTLAQQSLTGTITGIDRLNGTIAIQQTQSGTVGESGGGATEQNSRPRWACWKTCTPATGWPSRSAKAAARRPSPKSI